jgi:hypothetical protein
MRHLLAALTLPAIIAAPALGQETVSISLNGATIANGQNIVRSSAPNTISPSNRYTYVVSGTVQGTPLFSALGLLFASPTPLAQVLEQLSPGSSAALSGTIDNCSGTHPAIGAPVTQSGTSVVGGITVTFGLTLQTGINADNTASFSMTNITVSPSSIGGLRFTAGSVVLTRAPFCAADCDASGSLSPADFTCFLAKYRAGDPAANCDCTLDATGLPTLSPADFTCYLGKYRQGCP